MEGGTDLGQKITYLTFSLTTNYNNSLTYTNCAVIVQMSRGAIDLIRYKLQTLQQLKTFSKRRTRAGKADESVVRRKENYYSLKVARLDFFGLIPPKLEH